MSDNTGATYRAGGPRQPAEKRLLLFGGRAYPELAEEIAGCLDIQTTPTMISDFANGEIFVRSLESVRGCDAFVLQSHTSPINQWIMEQLIMVDALKRASARRITVVTPFFGYARQDKKSRGREPISARLMADSVRHRRSRQADGRRPAHRPDTGILRRSRRSPVRAPDPRRVHRGPAGSEAGHRGRAGRRPGPGLRALDGPARLPAGDHPQAARPRRGQPGQGARGRRQGAGTYLHPGQRHG